MLPEDDAEDGMGDGYMVASEDVDDDDEPSRLTDLNLERTVLLLLASTIGSIGRKNSFFRSLLSSQASSVTSVQNHFEIYTHTNYFMM